MSPSLHFPAQKIAEFYLPSNCSLFLPWHGKFHKPTFFKTPVFSCLFTLSSVIKAAKQSSPWVSSENFSFLCAASLHLNKCLIKNLSGNFSGASFQFLYKNPNSGNILWGLKWNPLCPYSSRTMWGRWVSLSMLGLASGQLNSWFTVDATGKSFSNLRSSLLLPHQILFPVMFIFFSVSLKVAGVPS